MNLKVKQIFIESHKALYTEDNGTVIQKRRIFKIFLFDILPFIAALYMVLSNNIIKGDSDLIANILTICSIFAGLLFSLIIVIVDKAKKMKEEKNQEKESDFYFLKKYLRFSKHLIVKIAFTIIVSLLIIVLSATINIDFHISTFLPKIAIYKGHFLSFFIYYFSIQFILLILDIISDMYDVFLDEINTPS